MADSFDLIAKHVRLPESSWSMGAFGAIAEFHRDIGETCVLGMSRAVTELGAIGIDFVPGTRMLAYEILSARAESWLHGVSFCLPAAQARMSRRKLITQIGPDSGALREEDRGAILFDLGLGAECSDFCVRTADAGLIERLRREEGTPLLECCDALMEFLTEASPHRVMLSRLGRIEVYQAIAPKGGASPHGPHTHLLPKFLRRQRTHAAPIPIPAGWSPCVNLYPANPVRDEMGNAKQLNRAEHAAFQALLDRHGDPNFVRAKQEVSAALRAGKSPAGMRSNRFERIAARVALRQWRQAEGDSALLATWREAYDPVSDRPDRVGAMAH